MEPTTYPGPTSKIHPALRVELRGTIVMLRGAPQETNSIPVVQPIDLRNELAAAAEATELSFATVPASSAFAVPASATLAILGASDRP